MATEKVLLAPRSRVIMLVSAMEVYPRETNGFLIHTPDYRSQEDMTIVDNTYSLQTEKRKRRSVKHGNMSAVGRTMGAMSLMKRRQIIGGYHSHTNGYSDLTDDDMNFIEEEMGRLGKYGIRPDSWLEIVMGVKKKEYRSPQEPGVDYSHFPRKARTILRMNQGNGSARCGYDITMGAYWVLEEDGRFRKQEAELLFPEFL